MLKDNQGPSRPQVRRLRPVSGVNRSGLGGRRLDGRLRVPVGDGREPGIKDDVTDGSEQDERALESALAAKDAELVRFTRAVSHDLRNSLVTARAFLRFLEADLAADDREKVAVDLEHLGRSIAHMERLLEQLVSWSLSGRFAPRSDLASFEAIAREAVRQLEPRLIQRRVEVAFDDALPSVAGDHEQLVVLVRELLDDVSKHAGLAGRRRVRVGARVSPEGETVFTIHDGGESSADDHSTLDPSPRDGSVPSDSNDGVGLTLARRIVQLHGGRIWIESVGELRSGFCFTLGAPA